MELSAISDFVKSLVNEDFMLVVVLTFFVCEGIFAVWKQIEYKKIVSVLVGGVLGFVVMGGAMGFILGGVAGGATTMVVAKFTKKA